MNRLCPFSCASTNRAQSPHSLNFYFLLAFFTLHQNCCSRNIPSPTLAFSTSTTEPYTNASGVSLLIRSQPSTREVLCFYSSFSFELVCEKTILLEDSRIHEQV